MFSFTHKELVEIGYRWILNNARCGIAFKELSCASNGEIPDVIGFSSWGHSVVIECKTSYSDFLADKQKPFRKDGGKGMGKYRFYLCPFDLIKPEECPTGWGLVYVDEHAKAKIVFNPYGGVWKKSKCCFNSQKGNTCNIEAETQLLYSVIRRLFIKGHVKHIYDKQYNKGLKPNQIISRNAQYDEESIRIPDGTQEFLSPSQEKKYGIRLPINEMKQGIEILNSQT